MVEGFHAAKIHRGATMGYPRNKYWTGRGPAPYAGTVQHEELRSHAAAARMRIDVTSVDLVITQALRAEVRRCVLLTMSRYGREVHDVTARLDEPPNPLGGVDQRCRMRARLVSGLVLRAEAINGQMETAVGRSVARLGLRVAAALDEGGPARPSKP